ncbi:MAG: response regulator, partial [Desulfobulbaceae bacterium]
EDEELVAADIQMSVEKMGYAVCAMASSGMEAVQKAKLTRPDLILMDIVLKGSMDGIEAATRIKDLYQIPVVYLTAFGENAMLQKAKAAEPYGYMTKPFNDRELHIAIEISIYKKEAENKIRKMERWFASVLKSIGEAVITSDKERRITFMNSVAEKLTGWSQEDALGKKLTKILNIKEKDLGDLEKHLVEKVITEGRDINLIEDCILIGKDGVEIPISNSAAPINEENGEISGSVLIFRDMTASKLAEQEKLKLQERLNRAEKMESLGILAGGVAHDLNNVLGVILGYAELLLLKTDESSASRPQIQAIMKGGQRAAAIVDDLLTLARRGVTGKDVLNLNKIITDCLQTQELLNLSFYHPSVKIKTDLDPDLLNISGSSIHFDTSIYNLISNASEAMPGGGVVTIKTTNQYLDKPVHGYDKIKDGDYVVLSVSDTGEGIHKDDIKRVFEPFYTKKVMGRSGTGLGLAVVWGTVKDHHGYINVHSEKGKGCTFTMYFPITREELSAEHISVAVSEYKGKGESILIVDDVKEQRDIATVILEELNYSVSSVKSGEEAVAYLQENHVDLMVLDMIMDPGMDGLDTYRNVLELYPQQKAVVVSGFSESERVKAVQSLGAGTYVKKPYVIEKLGLAIRKELDRTS